MPPEGMVAAEPCAEQDAAFNGIVKQYYEKILKFCIYALGGSRSVAEDCVQDIFLILYENMPRLKDYERIGGWLYKTAGHISKQYAASMRKERKRFADTFSDSASEAEDRETPLIERIAARDRIKTEEEQLAEEQAIERTAAEIGKRLSPKDKQILELAFREKHPLKEVAARLDISLSAAKSRASRFRQKIQGMARELLAD